MMKNYGHILPAKGLTRRSRSELCGGSLTTKTTHNTVMLHWKKRKEFWL